MEIWRDIQGYEGLYQVSNYGRVKSLCAGRWHTEMIRKAVPDKDGYLTVVFKKDNKVSCYKIHRLVASAFISNPNNLPHINHKDENKTNNHVSNLEWCTAKYNNYYHDKCKRCCKEVCMLDDLGNVLKVFPSINDAAKEVGVTPSHLSTVLSRRRSRNKYAGGYRWKFLKEVI